MLIADGLMKLGEKIRYLREVEGSLRGLDRAMSQLELVRAIERETGSKLSQSYLSQIESGARPHLTNTTRQILAGFFKVHPGYLVDDPEGYSPELQSELRNVEDKLDLWLVSGAERFRRDPELKHALLTLARNEHSRECLLLLEAILETPGLAPRLAEVLRPKRQGSGIRDQKSGRRERGCSREGQDFARRARKETGGAQMTWESFYLVCFLVGLFLSAFTLLGGMGHFRRAVDQCACAARCRMFTFRMRRMRRTCRMPRGAADAAQGPATVPWWNAFSIMIFLCWFGAAGYLLTRYGSFVAGVVVVLAAICGLIGGAIIFLFLTRVLMPHEHELTADETESWAR